MQFVPQQTQAFDLNDPLRSYSGKLSTLNSRLSPILPLHFDKSYLPSNLCEKQYLKMAQCRIFYRIQNSNLCSYPVTKFQNCRKDRDIRILDGIKKWETKHINSLDKSNQKMYLQGLTFKLDRLKQDYAKVPSTQSKQIKMVEIQNQIQTIKWRINYIKKIIV